MASVNVTAVNVLDNPAPYTNPLQFEIHYECLNDLADGAFDLRRSCAVSMGPERCPTSRTRACRPGMEACVRGLRRRREA